MDGGRRPTDCPYVVTQGTFQIERVGNYLIADTDLGLADLLAAGGRMVYRTAGLPPLASRHDLAALLVVQVRRRPGECPKGHGAGYAASAARQHHILPPPARKVALIVSRLAMTAFRTATARSSCPAFRSSTFPPPVPSSVAGSRRGTMPPPLWLGTDCRDGACPPRRSTTGLDCDGVRG